MKNFETFLTEKNDEIDSAAVAFLKALSLDADDDILYDMRLIGELEDYAENLLRSSGVDVCHPYYEGDEEIPCPKGDDCHHRSCPLRK